MDQSSEEVGWVQGNLTALVKWAADRYERRPFLHELQRDISLAFGEVYLQVQRAANHLRAKGVSHGDRVVILTENRIEVPILAFAAASIGAIFSILNELLTHHAVNRILAQCEPRAVILSDRTAHFQPACGDCQVTNLDEEGPLSLSILRSARVPVCGGVDGPVANTDHDPVALIFTSGSTGEPKGVVLSHDNVLFTSVEIQRRLEYRSDDVVGMFLPLSFDYGLFQVFLTALAGGQVAIGEARMVGPDFCLTLRKHGVTVLPTVPTVVSALLLLLRREPDTLPALRMVTSTGEHFPDTYAARLAACLPHAALYVMYGLTECKRVSILLPRERASKPGSVGRCLDGIGVAVWDEQQNPVPAGTIGELVVRGRNVALGYWRDPELTCTRFRESPISGNRGLLTGDQGWMDAEGYIYVLGRKDGLLKHRGYRVSATEIEQVATTVSGILGAAVVRSPDADELHLFLCVGGGPVRVEEVAMALRASLEPYKIPEHIHFISDLPRHATGKVHRGRLIASLRDGL